MLSWLTTLKYIIKEGGSVKWPLATYLTFLLRSNFTSNIKWQVISWNSGSTFSSSLSSLNATLMLSYSFFIASYQRVFPFFASNSLASSTFWGISIPNFILGFLAFCTPIFAMMRSHFLKVLDTHQLKAGSLWIFCMTNILPTWLALPLSPD